MPDSSSSRLEAVLADYLRRIEAGERVEEREVLAQHPDLAADLASFFRNRAAIARLAGPMQAAAEEMPTTGLGGQPAAANGHTIRYFGDYELVEEIARGGMGIVFRARQVSLNRLVALKMILSGQLAAPEDVRRFQQEAEAAANLDHPRIVPIYEIGEHHGQHYFSMKLIEGGSLAQLLRTQSARMSERDAAQLIATVARAVHHAHQRGLLHRDLKPGNILLDADGEPHVTDFGLAKRVESASDLTHSGAVLGTPSYMAPEQAAAERTLTTACDVYSLGAILFELLTGRPPFRGSTPAETILQLLSSEPPTPSSIHAALDRDLETICLKCLEKDPAQRYDSAAALADDLQRWLRGEPIAARPTTTSEQLVKWIARHPALAGLAGTSLIALLLLVGLGVSSLYQVQLQRSLDTEVAAKAEAERLRGLAAKSEHRVQEVLYAADVSLAQHEWSRTNMSRTRALLARHEPGEGVPDLLGFEWHYLNRLAHLEQAVLRGHTQPVYAVSFAMDGRVLVTSDRADRWNEPAVVRRWDLRDPGKSAVIWTQAKDEKLGYYPPAGKSAATPRGKIVAVCDNARVRLLDIETGDELRVLPAQEHNPEALCFSADGKLLAVGDWEGEVCIWETATGNPVAKFKGPRCGEIAFSPDAKHVATGSYDFALWEVEGPKLVGDFAEVPAQVTSAVFSAGGDRVAAGLRDGTIVEWNRATRELTHSVAGLTDQSVTGIAYAGAGRVVAASEDAQLRVWDLAKQECVATFKGHDGKINALTRAPDGTLATAGRDGTVRLWKVGPDPARAVLGDQPWAMNTLACTRDSRTLVVADYTGVRTYDAKTLERTAAFAINHWVFHAAFAPDGKTIATGGNSGLGGQEPGVVKFWRLADGFPQGVWSPPMDSIQGVAYSPDGTLVLATGWQRQPGVALWSVAEAKQIAHWKNASQAAFTHDNRLALAREGELAIWDRSSQELRPLVKKDDPIVVVSCSPTEPLVVAARQSGLVELWDYSASKQPWQLPTSAVDGRTVSQLVFSPDGKKLAIVTPRETLVAEAAPGRILARVAIPASLVTFTPDGRTLVTTAGEVQLWQAETGHHLLDLGNYSVFEMTCLTIAPDNSLLAVAGGSRDENMGIYVWKAR